MVDQLRPYHKHVETCQDSLPKEILKLLLDRYEEVEKSRKKLS